ncbi:MAG TPA: hypothetical protein VN732_10330 [Solirubrobacterales bacterium]|nr:hypothetical protein [Solirubrobacterales bacterium]
MRELLAALEAPEVLADEGGPVPPFSVQVAGLVVAEAVRLIRLGTRLELAEAADELAQALIEPPLSQLKQDRPEAHRQLSAASVTLGAAVAPSSSGGEMAVLRSWNGNAKQVLALINEEQGQVMERAKLREHLGGIEESYLSHLLADLEEAGLVAKVKRGKTVSVHLGRTAREEHVQREISRHEFPPIDSAGVEEGGIRLGTWPTRIDRGRGDQDCERILGQPSRENPDEAVVPARFTNRESRKRADNIVKSLPDRRPDTPRLAGRQR